MVAIMSERVMVGLSGGVDSSVAAYLLQQKGYDVVGAFIRVWHPDFLPCTEAEDRLEAMRVAATLGIPFTTIDAREEYKTHVADTMLREYEAGRTPNPDILCNTFVKFGTFLNARTSFNATKVATGHYATVSHKGGAPELHAARDTTKDQSYFLSGIPKASLHHTLFPLGDLLKSEVRQIAHNAQLPTADRPDSQGICFLGTVDMRSFLSHYIQEEPGVVEDEVGRPIGTHRGTRFYTLGERHGFTISAKSAHDAPHYIVERDHHRNVLVVAHTPAHIRKGNIVSLSDLNELVHIPSDTSEAYDAVFRYHGKRVPVTLIKNIDRIEISLNEDSDRPSPGQTCVLYRENVVVGSGIISS
jgi:tRNA-uridine 2-sulfurtransferase